MTPTHAIHAITSTLLFPTGSLVFYLVLHIKAARHPLCVAVFVAVTVSPSAARLRADAAVSAAPRRLVPRPLLVIE